jgi:UDP-N-acetylmuramoyl-L-alanyl-D-glutamate--2,6-diaminopimelate ligase
MRLRKAPTAPFFLESIQLGLEPGDDYRTMPQELLQLLQSLPAYHSLGSLVDRTISQVTADSREVGPGALFVAIEGATSDGHRYIPAALASGAAAVVGTAYLDTGAKAWPAPYIRVDDARSALATLAASFYDFPSRRLRLIGVTGTDGKTTTTHLITHILRHAGMHPGMISTVGAQIGEQALDTGLHVTTPDAPAIQRYLAQMVDAGCDSAVIEATSHGLHQGRVAACDFDVAVVTNVTHEHLDYHGTWQAYLDAKALLFRSLATSAPKQVVGLDASKLQPKVAVLNADDASFEVLRSIPADAQLSYSMRSTTANVVADAVVIHPDRTTFVVRTPAGTLPVESALVGEFNVYNCLAAISSALAMGLPLPQAVAALATLPPVDGRMERIDRGQDFVAIVDFAHTPASLQRALEAARLMTSGRVLAVFGSAGLRDALKRPLMAETAARLADRSILTAEDPRTESLDLILAQMAEGARRVGAVEGERFCRIPDRTTAIQAAVDQAQPGDVVLVCGKGHEQSMCFGAVEYPWRDQVVLAWALDRRLGSRGASAPFWLPTAEGEEQDLPSARIGAGEEEGL